MSYKFEADEELGQYAQKRSLHAVDVAKKNFDLDLDFTEESVERVEQLLGELHQLREEEDPGKDRIWAFAEMFGSYVGEVMRRHHGGEWGLVEMDGQRFPGIMFGTTTCWPWARVHNRLTVGPEDNVWHYYQSMTSNDN
jgi:hypothetical protein